VSTTSAFGPTVDADTSPKAIVDLNSQHLETIGFSETSAGRPQAGFQDSGMRTTKGVGASSSSEKSSENAITVRVAETGHIPATAYIPKRKLVDIEGTPTIGSDDFARAMEEDS